MKTAIKGNQLIYLDQINRSSYQQLYNEGKKGLLQCPVCSEKVRLILGIEKDPHFQHILTRNPVCQDQEGMMESAVTAEVETETNGFRLPQSRTITTNKEPSKRFKSAQTISQLPPFHTKEKMLSSIHSPYIQALQDAHIYLDANQVKAVVHPNGALLVLSGAGSGKTRVLTARTAFLLAEQGVEANRIMLVTFTAKAAAEMKERILNYPNIMRNQINRLVTGTFHSLFYRILTHHVPQKWTSDLLRNKEWQRRQILKEAGKEIELDEKEFAYDA